MDNEPMAFTPCADMSTMVPAHLSRVSHVFRDGPNIRALLTAYLQQAAEVERTLCLLLDNFRVDDATGDQLTTLGLWVGLDRTVCRVYRPEVLQQCSPGEVYALQDYTFTSDDTYRKFIKAKVYAQAFDGTLHQYERIVQYLFDDIDFDDASATGSTRVTLHGGGLVNITVNRPLTTFESQLIDLYKTVLPYFGTYAIEVFAGTEYFVLTTESTPDSGMCQPIARAY